MCACDPNDTSDEAQDTRLSVNALKERQRTKIGTSKQKLDWNMLCLDALIISLLTITPPGKVVQNPF